MRLFLLIFGFLTTSEVYLLAAEAGMPQLDPTYWASQGFWLILIFTLLYLALSKLFIPKIKNSIDDRENRIKDDLDEAQKLKEVAEAKLKEYEISIENAEKEIESFKKDSLESISKISEEITSKIIENISGEPMNQSSVKATVQESVKRNIGKYL